jgi:aspartate oxidase
MSAHPVQRRRGEAYAERWRSVPTLRPPVPAFPPSSRALAGRSADEAAAWILAETRKVMTTDVGLVRTETGLRRARKALARLARRLPPEAWRAHNQLLVARLITRAALRRRESRGGHRRLDYPPLPPPSPSVPSGRQPSGTSTP